MSTKNIIQIVETPVIDRYDFQENNGIINPAFLESHPTEEEDTSSSRALVNSDYRGHCFRQNGQNIVQYPTDDLIIEHRPNGTSVASSWVYEFNNCNNTPTRRPNMTSSPNSMSGMYRPAYGTGYNEHLSYEMDLNRDHRKNKKMEESCDSDGCWPTCVKLFVWTIILVCLMGVFLSIAFIIYIEKFAIDSCCSDSALNTTISPTISIHRIGGNGTTVGQQSVSQIMTDSTPAPIDLISIESDFNSSSTEGEPTTTTNVTTNMFFETIDNNSSTEVSTTDSLVINGQNSELNVTEEPLKSSETTKYVSTLSTTMSSIITSIPTSTTVKPIKSVNNTTKKTTNSFDSRVLTSNTSQTLNMDINSTEDSFPDPINGHKSGNLSPTTLSPEEYPTNININNSSKESHPLENVSQSGPQNEERTTLEPPINNTTSVSETQSQTLSSVGSNYSKDHYNQTEPAINQKSDHINGNITTSEATKATITSTTSTAKPTTLGRDYED